MAGFFVSDFHNDCLTALPRGAWEAYFERLRGVAAVTAAIFTTEIGREKALETIEQVQLFPINNEQYRVWLAIEDSGCFLESDWDRLLAARPVAVSLTWNYDNAYAGGALGEAGLTDLGRRWIRRLNEQNIVVDLAHLNRRSFFEALELARRPAVTHTGLYEICPHPRNLTDEQIRALVARGGIVGLALVKDFYLEKREQRTENRGGKNLATEGALNTSNDKMYHAKDNMSCDKRQRLEETNSRPPLFSALYSLSSKKDIRHSSLMKAINLFCQKYGAEHLCFGTDFFGTANFVGEPPLADYFRLQKFLENLSEIGYNKEVIEYIATKNLEKFFMERSQ